MANIKKYNVKQLTAIELMASQPHLTNEQIAKKCNISRRTLTTWSSNPLFVESVYERYMEISGAQIPNVIEAMINEAKLGNVQAGRLILEHYGKLENKLKIEVESNFDKFMRFDGEVDDAEFFEVSKEQEEVLDKVSAAIGSKEQLPDRDTSNDQPKIREKKEKDKLLKVTRSSIKRNSQKDYQNKVYRIRKRAKAVGLALLPAGRHPKGRRTEWEKQLERLEIEKFGEIQE